MARVSINLWFLGITEEVFNFYRSIFGGEFSRWWIARFSEIPPMKWVPPVPEADKNLVMHVELPIFKDYLIMGADVTEAMGRKLVMGNNVSISLEPDSKEETDRLFKALSAGGKVTMELMDAFRWSYFGMCEDKYWVQRMFNYTKK